ncbi:hypothetical protein CRYUN_Cryun07bG0058300 [Craigia yunnanensis]
MGGVEGRDNGALDEARPRYKKSVALFALCSPPFPILKRQSLKLLIRSYGFVKKFKLEDISLVREYKSSPLSIAAASDATNSTSLVFWKGRVALLSNKFYYPIVNIGKL